MPDVLLVEDEAVVRRAAGRICEAEALTIEMEQTVDAALDRLREQSFRLVLVDLMLPERPGFDLLEELVASQGAPPVIMISGFATLENSLRSFELGAFDFVPKPFDIDELLGVVRRGLRWGDRGVSGSAQPVVEGGGDLYLLGQHAWARLDRLDGTATLGLAETFSGMMGELVRVELPERGSTTVQGKRLARLEDGESLVYRVWSPLSGRILAVNEDLSNEPQLLDRSPFGSGWLVRIIPVRQEDELRVLSLR